LTEIQIEKTTDVQCESEPSRRIKCNEIGNRFKSILQPSKTISQEDKISDNDLADDMKWVRFENSKKKRKLADRNSPKQTMQNVTTASTAATHMQPK
jgi:hypothetical protein